MKYPKMSIKHVLQVFSMKMMIEWKERGHEVEYHQALHDPNCVNALQNCGLLKFFQTSRLRAQLELLEYLIGL